MNETPSANRVHIGFYGRRNSGKSSLLNALTGQQVAITSEVAGTTTDPVYKPMEIHGIGPCVLIDTAGFDDVGELGQLRIEKTKGASDKTDIAVLLFSSMDMEEELQWYGEFQKKNSSVLCVVSKCDVNPQAEEIYREVEKRTGTEPVMVNVNDRERIERFKERLIRMVPEDYGAQSITGKYIKEDDVVLLVMPQDIQAPKGRLILPQVQTIRDLLDNRCIVMSVTTDKLSRALGALRKPPALIITDSQVFGKVYEQKPEESRLTSFSVLFAEYKGDIDYYVKSAEAIAHLNGQSRVLIAECCTHAPLTEDIGREKIPRMLRKRAGESLRVDIVGGMDFPKDLSPYDLIIQCGACMFNRKYVITRIERAKEQGIPMSNYGVVLAYLNGILDKIEAGT